MIQQQVLKFVSSVKSLKTVTYNVILKKEGLFVDIHIFLKLAKSTI